MKNLIVCIGDMGGMMFNHRRVSRDKAVVDDIIKNIGITEKLYAEEYSRTLFGDSRKVRYTDDMFAKAGRKDSCFAERPPVSGQIDNTEKLTVYRWNRNYPFDEKLDAELENMKLVSTEEFVGNAHEKITKETYTK